MARHLPAGRCYAHYYPAILGPEEGLRIVPIDQQLDQGRRGRGTCREWPALLSGDVRNTVPNHGSCEACSSSCVDVSRAELVKDGVQVGPGVTGIFFGLDGRDWLVELLACLVRQLVNVV